MAPPKTPTTIMFNNITTLEKDLKKLKETDQDVSAGNDEANNILTAKLARAEKRLDDKEDECDRMREEKIGEKGAVNLKEQNEKLTAEIATLQKELNYCRDLLGKEWTKNLDGGVVKQDDQVKVKGKDDGDDDGQGTKRKAEAMEDDGQ